MWPPGSMRQDGHRGLHNPQSRWHSGRSPSPSAEITTTDQREAQTMSPLVQTLGEEDRKDCHVSLFNYDRGCYQRS